MADNYTFKDAASATQTNSAKDEGGGVYSSRVTPRVAGADVATGNPLPVTAATLPLPTGAAAEAGHLATIDTSTASTATSASTIATNSGLNGINVQFRTALNTILTRPADTTQYAVADLVANNTSAGSVAPLQWTIGRVNGGGFQIFAAEIVKSTTANISTAGFRLYLFTALPSNFNVGDNGANAAWDGMDGCIGYIDLACVKGGNTANAWGTGYPANNVITANCAGGSQLVYGVLVSTSTYTPGSAETFQIYLSGMKTS